MDENSKETPIENNDTNSTSVMNEIQDQKPETEDAEDTVKQNDVTDNQPGKGKKKRLSKGRDLGKKKNEKEADLENPQICDYQSGHGSFDKLHWFFIIIAVVVGIALIVVLLYFTVIKGILEKQKVLVNEDGVSDSVLIDKAFSTASGLIMFTDATTERVARPSKQDMLRGGRGRTTTTEASGGK